MERPREVPDPVPARRDNPVGGLCVHPSEPHSEDSWNARDLGCLASSPARTTLSLVLAFNTERPLFFFCSREQLSTSCVPGAGLVPRVSPRVAVASRGQFRGMRHVRYAKSMRVQSRVRRFERAAHRTGRQSRLPLAPRKRLVLANHDRGSCRDQSVRLPSLCSGMGSGPSQWCFMVRQSTVQAKPLFRQ